MTAPSSAVQAAMRADGGRRHTFAQFYIDEGTVYLWDGDGTIDYDENTYVGTGSLGTVEFNETKISEMSGAFTMLLSGTFVGDDGGELTDGLQTALTKTLTGTALQGRKVTVFMAVTDLEGTQVLYDPYQSVTGIMDVIDAPDNEMGAPSLRISVEDRAYLETLVTPRKYCLADHQRMNPGSTWMKQTAVLDAQDINWGKSA
ncbi:hypothetical protein FF098_014850 [Parvularcula flava]|uniref:Uncharacterized protein n=1 Tax=Aquisalinus luteolus TaxID=1566827 RepID=A0A8J3A3C5_9PROT|nr:hypothetical protein [Aquisalinus luteolus]NHK29197.1 hypothetical protein [Aquisalinus luteolus]GGI00006.1 hypothetical protein GCM10011355_27280 [Aquisalinus luteolus]